MDFVLFNMVISGGTEYSYIFLLSDTFAVYTIIIALK